MKITLEVSEDNEATSYPWWVILDAGQNMSLDIRVLANQITGPFFSRENAERHLQRSRYNFGKRARVYCMSGHNSLQYRQAHDLEKSMRHGSEETK